MTLIKTFTIEADCSDSFVRLPTNRLKIDLNTPRLGKASLIEIKVLYQTNRTLASENFLKRSSDKFFNFI